MRIYALCDGQRARTGYYGVQIILRREQTAHIMHLSSGGRRHLMKRKMACYAASVALAGLVAAAIPAPAFAKDAATCVSSEEAAAFQMRDLQSRLMVAALSCNQLTAYNSFMERFRPTLSSAGLRLVSYYKRTGGGEPALNRHLTEMANAAGLLRAEAPEQYCGDTWAMFLLLEDEPTGLPTMAAKYTPAVAQCSAPDADVNAPVKVLAPEIVPLPTTPTGAPVVKAAATN
jgi:hypothetical protein